MQTYSLYNKWPSLWQLSHHDTLDWPFHTGNDINHLSRVSVHIKSALGHFSHFVDFNHTFTLLSKYYKQQIQKPSWLYFALYRAMSCHRAEICGIFPAHQSNYCKLNSQIQNYSKLLFEDMCWCCIGIRTLAASTQTYSIVDYCKCCQKCQVDGLESMLKQLLDHNSQCKICSKTVIKGKVNTENVWQNWINM